MIKKQDLINELLDFGHTNEELAKMSKPELEELLAQIKKANAVLDNVNIQELGILPEDQAERDRIEEATRPRITDVKWTEYVLSLLTEDELYEGSPKCDGLRRVATLLLGDFSTDTQVIQSPNVTNNGHAVVATKLSFANGINVSDVSDASPFNTTREFAIHAVACASTKSEGRALKRALKLVKVTTVEEKLVGEPAESQSTDNIAVPTSMLNGLKLMAGRQSIDLGKLAAHMGFNAPTIEQLTKREALDISNQLTKYSTKEVEIPTNIKL